MSDGAVELLQLRANELLAAAAIYGDGLVLEDVHPAELLVAAEEGAFDAATHSHLAAVDTRLALALRPDAGAACTARLHLRMPHRYPEAPLEVEAVSSATCGRQWEADCQRRLQGLATAAAGRECLHELLAVLLDTLQPAGGGSSEQPGGAPAAAAGQQPAALQSLGEQEQEQEQVLLLRLDHMRDRPGYSRTLRRWARELGLAGRLLFCGGGRCSRGLILVLLEGPAGGAREFQKRLRTCNVDVDSAGRPCRERMMRVVCCADRRTLAGDSSGGGSGGAPPRAFSGFEEEEVALAQLAERLQAAHLLHCWAAATGLPALRT